MRKQVVAMIEERKRDGRRKMGRGGERRREDRRKIVWMMEGRNPREPGIGTAFR